MDKKHITVRIQGLSSKIESRLAMSPRDKSVRFQQSMYEFIWEHAETIDGEWGCCHNKTQILNGSCWYFNDERVPDGLKAFADLYEL